jgi:lipase chaperone LimK
MPRAQCRQMLVASMFIAAGALLLDAIYHPQNNGEVRIVDDIKQIPMNATFTAIASKMSDSHPHSKTQPTAEKSSAFAPSLRDTQRDGNLRSDADGNLVMERGIRDLFDYYLTTLGEKNLKTIHGQLQSIFAQELPMPAAEQAAQLLDAYLNYRKQSGDLQNAYPTPTDDNAAAIISDYFSARDALRSKLFAPQAVDAFFAADIANEKSAQQTLQQLADQHAGLPVNDSGSVTNAHSQYYAATHAPTPSTRTAAENDALREQIFGGEAAERLAALDQQRSDWATRVNSYRTQKQQLLNAADRAGIDPTAQLEDLQHSQFDAREIVRIRALDRVQQ